MNQTAILREQRPGGGWRGSDVDAIRFLMRMPDPSPEIRDAIESAVAWFRSSALTGMRLERPPIEPQRFLNHTADHDVVVVKDEAAPPLWARFYELDTGRPFLCTRDGLQVYSLAEVQIERRTGYAWYGYWPAQLLTRDYPEWKRGISSH